MDLFDLFAGLRLVLERYLVDQLLRRILRRFCLESPFLRCFRQVFASCPCHFDPTVSN